MKDEKIEPRFAVCINNSAYPDDLKVRTIYQILPDESAGKSNYIRVIDETGEDYLYSASCFVVVEIPPDVAKTFLAPAIRQNH